MAPLAHTLALLAMTMATAAIEVVPLDMAQNSFDDQYQGCGPAMAAALPALNRSEFQQNPLFAEVWANATAKWQEKGSCVSYLPSDQAIALMAYTMDDLHEQFNAAVRKAGSSPREYRDNFHFKALHFLLTDALATLRGQKCYDVFRGVSNKQFKAQRGQKVRFGQFASTSLSKAVAQRFGTDTVFQVHTCHGGYIQRFSCFSFEKEVLIPPFETFEVTNVTQDKKGEWIQLRSTGTLSNYNCEWLKDGSGPRDPPLLRGLLLATTALAVASGIL
ncbi:erythroblast NAD(P)(+)--arginine ADP-ribosyltransferase-like [Corvus cornix cornix]|uniref:erythroblast NAD(P)(+)--arginine ADP-ribosyltransferase-like n=1 Tax=Corvus cornix cornix TaxID=932674 RepID=UPI00194E6000|nr:erythroblast NAD(P)(+)--arginine ADP-ribosyltransferase-like [Corvus cornix cornix]